LPLVRKVGGLADTVVDCSLENMGDGLATGFVFESFDDAGIGAAVRRAFALYQRADDWKRVQVRAMHQQFGWDGAAAQYVALYQQIGT
jgi:starch synthase